MVFKRRDKLHWVENLRAYILPRRGWKRALTYMGHRLKRLPDTANRIALGLAFGVFTSWSPFFGLHIILALILARIFGANLFSAAAGTFFGSPLTFPFIITFALKLGNWMLGRDPAEQDIRKIGHGFSEASKAIWQSFKSLFGFGKSQLHGLGDFLFDVVLPYFIGGLMLGALFGVATYYASKPLIEAYQAHRRKKMAEKNKKKAEKG